MNNTVQPITIRQSSCVVIIRHGLIAAIKSKKHNFSLELPGGKRNPAESAEQNAVRECFEEVGVRPYLIRRLLEEMDVGGYMCSTYLAKIGDHVELVSSPEGQAVWVTPAEMLTGTYAEHTAKWLPMVADELDKR